MLTPIEAGDIPGIVARAASRDGSQYAGAFGTSDLSSAAVMPDDALFYIASMTKVVTSVAAMQLVESGKLTLDEPLDSILTKLRDVKVLDGFDADGTPRMRPPRKRITLRHLLNHTSGFAYGHWNSSIQRYASLAQIPDVVSMLESSLDLPLVNDPGEEWNYGISTDYVGKAVEAISGETLDRYFTKYIFEPLAMQDTFYQVPAAQQNRIARIHCRNSEGSLQSITVAQPDKPEFFPGGVGLFSTAGDYLALTKMLLNEGTAGGATLLSPTTVRAMSENQLGAVSVPPMKSQSPFWSVDIDLYPGQEKRWGLGFLINTEQSPTGKHAGSLMWGGACNSFFWIDKVAGITGVFMSQVVPFCDPRALRAYHGFERAINGVP